VASTTTTTGGTAELTGLTGGDGYYISIIDVNGKPWFFTCPASFLGNTAETPRTWSYNPAPSAVQSTTTYPPFCRAYLIDNTPVATGTLVPFDGQSDESGDLTLDLATNAINTPTDAYFQITAHIDFGCQGGVKFTAGDKLIVSFYAGATLVSSTTVSPPTGTTTFSVENNDIHVGGSAYTVQASLVTTAGTTTDALAGSYFTVAQVVIPVVS
jgi:hypothetical protein